MRMGRLEEPSVVLIERSQIAEEVFVGGCVHLLVGILAQSVRSVPMWAWHDGVAQ